MSSQNTHNIHPRVQHPIRASESVTALLAAQLEASKARCQVSGLLSRAAGRPSAFSQEDIMSKVGLLAWIPPLSWMRDFGQSTQRLLV